MIRNITTVLALLAALSSCTGQNPETFTVHAEIMGAPSFYDAPAREMETAPATARNISIGTKSLYAYYDNAEFILSYCGEVFIEASGQDGKTVPADVYQIEPGVWIAEIPGGQYVKVFSESGNTNTDLDGEFRIYHRN